MLTMKPNCEHCDKDLLNGSLEAMICSYECTFCAPCVEDVLGNVCPNCGGGFVPRPHRVTNEWRTGVSATHQPPSADRVFKPVDAEKHRAYAAPIADILPEKR